MIHLAWCDTRILLLFCTSIFPKRAAKIGGMLSSFQIFLNRKSKPFLKPAPMAGLVAKLFSHRIGNEVKFGHYGFVEGVFGGAKRGFRADSRHYLNPPRVRKLQNGVSGSMQPTWEPIPNMGQQYLSCHHGNGSTGTRILLQQQG